MVKMVSFHGGDEECEKAIEEITDIDLLGIYNEGILKLMRFVLIGKPAKHLTLIAKTY